MRRSLETSLKPVSFSVLTAMLIGIGPGAAVQPCPKHRADHAAPAAHANHRAASAGQHGGPRTMHGHAGQPAEEGPHQGPCDCLAHCITCSASPAPPVPTAEVFAPRAPTVVGPTERVSFVGTDPASYLRPFARPPPA